MFRISSFIAVMILISLSNIKVSAQCCGVGGGNPVAGDASRGVLKAEQLEMSSYLQLVHSEKFMNGSQTDTGYLKGFSSNYVYTRLAFGLSERLTFAVETGYWQKKSQTGRHERDSYASNGWGDLILFPRYNIIKPEGKNRFNELTLGIGFKIPLGSYNDSVGLIEPFSGEVFYSSKPPAVQASSGANDLFFNLFWSRQTGIAKIRISSNAMYILKGWNPLGEKLGNYTSLGLFASRQMGESLNLALQLRGEWIGTMQVNSDIMMVSFPNYDPAATGSTKYFVSPQASYYIGAGFTAFAQAEIPVFQKVNKLQIASQQQLTFGIAYRMMTSKASGIINPTKIN